MSTPTLQNRASVPEVASVCQVPSLPHATYIVIIMGISDFVSRLVLKPWAQAVPSLSLPRMTGCVLTPNGFPTSDLTCCRQDPEGRGSCN
jgi:hypothetical protein